MWDAREDVTLPPQLNRERARKVATTDPFVAVRSLDPKYKANTGPMAACSTNHLRS
jgi:hypothetical protein